MKLTKRQLKSLIKERLEPTSEVPVEISDMSIVVKDLDYYLQQIVKGLDDSGASIDQGVYHSLDKMQTIIDQLTRVYTSLDKKSRKTPDLAALRHSARSSAFQTK